MKPPEGYVKEEKKDEDAAKKIEEDAKKIRLLLEGVEVIEAKPVAEGDKPPE